MSDLIKNKVIIIPFLLGIIFLVSSSSAKADSQNFSGAQKRITLDDGGRVYDALTNAQTVNDFLQEQKIYLNPQDTLIPEGSTKIYSGSNVIILRAKKVSIKEGGNTKQVYTQQNTVQDVVFENKIELDEDDITQPTRLAPVSDGMSIVVTHVLIREETAEQPIAFKTVTNEDDTLSWRIKKVTQKGVPGIKEVKYKVVYNDGKEISRKILESNVTQDPVDEVDTQGTFVKVGKASNGQASWYAFTGQLCAANPWLPLGSYARVTNQDNGKQVIVKINDRGPFGKGRIIDLDKVAFAQIADIGTGIINVKMEPITN